MTPNHVDLSAIVLTSGSHSSRDEGLCVMEAVAYFAGEPHSDHPACASPVLTKFCMTLNDRMDDETRQQLLDFVPRLVGTRASLEVELERCFVLLDAAVRLFAPLALRAAGCEQAAAQLEAVPPLIGHLETQVRVSAARSAARSAAWSAAWSAGSAAWSARSAALSWRGVLERVLAVESEAAG